MTTQVQITSPSPNHKNVLVEIVDENLVPKLMGQQVLKEGESTTIYIYDSQKLVISEVDK